jgi:hypothetical protein
VLLSAGQDVTAAVQQIGREILGRYDLPGEPPISRDFINRCLTEMPAETLD